MKLDMDSPEAPVPSVLRGDLSRCARPLLFACRSERQLRDVLRRLDVPREDARRIENWWDLPEDLAWNRFLFLLPGWDEDAATDDAVRQWVAEERHTCDLSMRPLPGSACARRFSDWYLRAYAALCGVCALALGIELVAAETPWRVAVPWLMAAMAFAIAAVERWEPRTLGDE